MQQHAAADAFHVPRISRFRPRTLHRQYTDIDFPCDAFERVGGITGGNQDLEKLLADHLDGRGVDFAIEGNDAAERRRGIGRERLSIRLERRLRDRGSARIGVFDDDAGRLGKALYAFPGCVAVADVIEREFLALELPVGRDGPRRRRFVTVEGCLLMRILAVAQILHLRTLPVEAVRKQLRRAGLVTRRQVVADRAVVRGSMRKRLLREPEARRISELPAVGGELVE